MEIVTNHGMPVRWSTAHYRFSRAPCTATLYRRPSLARSFTSFRLSSSWPTSLAFSLPSFLLRPANGRPSSNSLSLSFSRSVTVAPSHSCGYRFSLARTLPPEYYVLTEIAVLSLLFVSRIPSPSWCELSRSVYRRCCPPLFPPPMFPPTIAFSPSDSVSLHLSTIFILSLPFDLSSPSFSQYDSSAPPIERSSNSTTYRQIKFVLARRARHV